MSKKLIITSTAVLVLIGIVITTKNFTNNMNTQFITSDKARLIAEEKIQNGSPEHKMIIISTEQRADGWLFQYVPEKYLQTKNNDDLVPGNVPLLVHKDGSIEYIPWARR